MSSKAVSLFNTAIRTDAEGRFCLNDLHKAAIASGLATLDKKPATFLRNGHARDLVAEMDSKNKSQSVNTIKGRGITATYAIKDIFLEYAVWLGGASLKCMLYQQIGDAKAIIDALYSLEVPDDLPDLYVYAIKEIDTGNVKLGISRDPERRLKQLQIGNSSRLELVAYRKAENRFTDERQLHHYNAALRIHGEWFGGAHVSV